MRRIIATYGALIALLVISSGFGVPNTAYADDLTSDSYQVLGPVMSGGGYGTSENFILFSSISEFAHDIASGASLFSLNPGFIAYPFVSTPAAGATAGNAQVALTWTTAQGFVGWTVSGYDVGQSTVSGGPYTYSSIGNVLASTRTGLTNGTAYYFVIVPTDAFGNRLATSTQVSGTPTAPASPPPSSGGGGGGGAPPPSIPPSGSATINFSGRAYPRSTITLLKDAQVVGSSIADAKAAFMISLTNMSGGNFIFAIYSEDSKGNRSSIFSFPVSVVANATTNIGGIFISPTIDVDKAQVKQGDNIVIFGQSAPQSFITISVNSETGLFVQSQSDAIGAYLYNLDTSPLEMGSHVAKSKAAVAGEISDFGKVIGFTVGTQNVLKQATTKCGVGDLNCDMRANLVDFSIMVYWFGRTLSGNGFKADLNHDNKVNLVDFSIMASHWTG